MIEPLDWSVEEVASWYKPGGRLSNLENEDMGAIRLSARDHAVLLVSRMNPGEEKRSALRLLRSSTFWALAGVGKRPGF